MGPPLPASSARRTRWGSSVDNIRANINGASVIGKYVLGWIFGVPVVEVLIMIYLILN